EFGNAFSDFDEILSARKTEADEFYAQLAPSSLTSEQKAIQRQALAGLLWTKQFYYYIVEEWLEGDPGQPAPPDSRWSGRNFDWQHLYNERVMSMPDSWEFPWYASWDLAFHCIPLALVDPHFAKGQLDIVVREWYQHPNGKLPAYEWNFSDVNPPVLAWAAWRVVELARENHVYENIATKFFEHFLGIAAAMNDLGGCGIGLWNEEDEFYYDVLHTPGGRFLPLKVRSIVGLMPLLAVETIQWQLIDA